MTLLTEKGTFAKSTGAQPASQEVNLVGAFQPKALWLWGSMVTANATYNESHEFHYGFSDGTDDSAISGSLQDANGDMTVASSMIRNDAIVTIVDTATNAEIARASVTSFDSDGFTLSWTVNNATAYIIHYMAVGGTDITNAKVITTTTGTTSTGNAGYTGVGFQGNFVNFLLGSATATVAAVNTLSAGWGVWMGAAVSSSKRWTLGISEERGASLADNYAGFLNDQCLATYNHDTGAIDMEADFVSFDADGFTVNYGNAPASATQVLSFIVVKGGTWDLGDFAGQNDTNNQDIALTAGLTPSAVMIFSKGDATTDSGVAAEGNGRLSIGGADASLNQGCIWTGSQDGANISVTARISLVTELIRCATENATATSSTTTAACAINNMTTPDLFRIDWTTATLFRFAWFVVGPGAAPPAVTDEERYMAVSTLVGDYIPPWMNDLMVKIGGSRTNVRTFPMLKMRNSLRNSLSSLHSYVKQFLHDPCSSPDRGPLPHLRHGTRDQIRKTLDKFGPRLPTAVLLKSRHTLPSPIIRRF